jgi:hypothetical protein
MAFLDDARHSGRNSYEPRRHPWPREFMTLAVVAGCLAFWGMLVVGLSYFG